jgi:glycosyltransferase involved in cell wall biosynthesis
MVTLSLPVALTPWPCFPGSRILIRPASRNHAAVTPLVSILIPCYNAAPWLSQTIDSALAQTWPHCEIIVVNDGSTDASLAVARSYQDRGVRVIDQPNAGQSAAFNTAMRAARGEYLAFLDADDLLDPEKISVQMNELMRRPAGWLATGAWARFKDSTADANFIPGPVARDLEPLEWVLALWHSDSMMHGAAWLVPAPLVASNGGWNDDLSLINDFEFFSRIVLASRGVAYCAGARTYYRSGVDGSLSGQRTAAAWQSAYESVRRGTTRLLEFDNGTLSRSACANVWRNLAFDLYPDGPDALQVEAQRQVTELGAALGRPAGGPWFTAAARVFGWKAARRWQRRRARMLSNSR